MQALDGLSQGLIEHAEHQLSLLKPSGPRPKKGPDKRVTIRASLEAIAKDTGKRPARLDGPECPPELEYIWGWYLQARPFETLTELKAWADLYGHKPEEFEIGLLRRLASVEYRVASS